MKPVKLFLLSKNNKRNGIYLYLPIVIKDGKYFRCESVKTFFVSTINDIPLSQIKPTREILPQYYKEFNLLPL